MKFLCCATLLNFFESVNFSSCYFNSNPNSTSCGSKPIHTLEFKGSQFLISKFSLGLVLSDPQMTLMLASIFRCVEISPCPVSWSTITCRAGNRFCDRVNKGAQEEQSWCYGGSGNPGKVMWECSPIHCVYVIRSVMKICGGGCL